MRKKNNNSFLDKEEILDKNGKKGKKNIQRLININNKENHKIKFESEDNKRKK